MSTDARASFVDRMRAAWRRVLTLDDSPHSIALGVFIGTLVAYQPIVGFQMIVGAIVCKIIRANVIASLPLAWITNPVTIIPIYYLTYRLGVVFTGDEPITYDDIAALWTAIGELGLLDGIVEGTRMLLDIFWPMVVGGLLIGVVNGAIFYALVRRLVTVYQSRSIHRRRESASTPVEDEVSPP